MGGQPSLREMFKSPKPDPNPEDCGWEPLCTAKGMETYIIRTSYGFNYVLGNISPRYQPLWVKLWWQFKSVWCCGTNKKGRKTWLGHKLTKEILLNISP